MKKFRWVVWGLVLAAIALIMSSLMPPMLNGLSQSLPARSGMSGTQLLWYGQSAFKLTTPSGKVLLLDPWLQNPANPNGAADLEKLDRADLILVTHGHSDHIGDAVTIAQRTQAKLVSTFDLGQAMVHYSGYPQELVEFETQGNFGGELSLLNDEVKIAFIPAVHSSSVSTDGSPVIYAGNPGGFLVSVRNGPTIYHTGDTDLFGDMALISQFRKVTVMLACIGGQFTMGPERAAEAVKLVNPDRVVPMHFGTFNLPGTPTAFAQALKQQGVKTQLRVMRVGETLKL